MSVAESTPSGTLSSRTSRRVAHHARDADDDDRGDEEREQRVDPREVRQRDRDAADDDGDCAERVAEHVKERGAHVEIAPCRRREAVRRRRR